MSREGKVDENVRRLVADKLRGMIEFYSVATVAAKFKVHRTTISDLVSGRRRPSKALAERILGGTLDEIIAEIPCPHCNGVGRVRRERGLPINDETSGRVRNESVRASTSNVLRVQGQRRDRNELPVAQKESSTKSAPEIKAIETNAKPVVKLRKDKLTELSLQNRARTLAGIPPILVKVYTCKGCSVSFESTGDRFCNKCKHVSVAILSGREVF